MKYDAVVVASGKGERAKLGYNKVFYRMKNGKTVLENACSLFLEDEDCQNVIVVTNSESFSDVFSNDKLILVSGGKERKDSVHNGLNEVRSEYVFIHDGARPFLHKEALEELKREVVDSGACLLAKAAVDTIKVVKDGFVEKTLDRKTIYLAETPQCFRSEIIKKAYEDIGDRFFTDDVSLLEELGYRVKVVEDRFENRKLTKESDFTNI